MINFLFSQYYSYSSFSIFLEITGVIFGLLSVWYAKKNHILVFPTGIISTLIYVYLLWQWSLFGDMLINCYYFLMSIYGWYLWTRKKQKKDAFPIATISKKEKIQSLILFSTTVLIVIVFYNFFNKFTNWFSYTDTFLTGIFFVGMWLMAKRKIENWMFWIVGDIISIPLYFLKGFTFTSFQYLIFTIIAIFGYLEWKKNLYNYKLVEQTN